MNNHPIEERLRGALATQSQRFSASPDAWQRVEEKASRRIRSARRPRGTGWLARHSSFAVPATAAATVIAVALGASALSHGLSSTGNSANHHAPAKPAAENPVTAQARREPLLARLLATDPPIGKVTSLKLTRNITTFAWLGQPDPLFWFPYITTGPEFCQWTANSSGHGSGYCWPMSALDIGPTQPADVVTNRYNARAGNPVISGIARPDVTSVTAVLPDGRQFHGVVSTGLGSGPDKAWSVTSPADNGTKLIFTGAAGQILTETSTAAPPGPAVLVPPRPAHGGVTLFHFPISGTLPDGTVDGYLVGGNVAFFTSGTTQAIPFGEALSPHAASRPSAIGGLAAPLRLVCASSCRQTSIKAFGYAHGDVAKVVVRLPSGGQVTADTIATGWPGSDLRLWQVTRPDGGWPADGSQPKLIATAYDASGHSLGQVRLGQPVELGGR